MDPAWIGVIGAAAGAAAGGLPSVVTAIVQGFSGRGQRKHDAAQAELDRTVAADERRNAEAAALQERRRQKIATWRNDLREAVEAENDWRINGFGDVLRPRLIGQPWFEELRGYLSETFSFETDVYADAQMVGHLSRMISHMEREWGLAEWLPTQRPDESRV